MSKIKIEAQKKSFIKINGILNASKLKVLNRMSNVKAEASHNIMTALLSKNIFEFAKNNYGFVSYVYENNFETQKVINIVFINEKQTLSHSYERMIKKFINNKNPGDKNFVVADFLIKDSRLEDCIIISGSNIDAVAYDVIESYSSKKYKQVLVYSNMAPNNFFTPIIPMKNLEVIKGYKYENFITSRSKFGPTTAILIESSYKDYTRGLLKYFYINGKYTDLKNTLMKHETSIDHIEEKLEIVEKQLNKIRQSKITEEILQSYQGGENV